MEAIIFIVYYWRAVSNYKKRVERNLGIYKLSIAVITTVFICLGTVVCILFMVASIDIMITGGADVPCALSGKV